MNLKPLKTVFWTLHFICLSLSALWLAWWLLTPLDFGFRWGYHLLDIPAHIHTFAPQNTYKHGFETTTETEHMRQFSEIVSAINAGGKGLADVTYQGTLPHPEPLLRDAEIIHLQDVAQLVKGFHWLGAITLILWVMSVCWIVRKHWSFPNTRQIITGSSALLFVVGIVLLLMGPTAFFYWLHTRIFPQNHQWFFYYQESLMTTLMKAPDLFGFIALLWIGAGILLMIGATLALKVIALRQQ